MWEPLELSPAKTLRPFQEHVFMSMDMDEMDMGPGAFETFGKGDMPVEGDATMNESQLHYRLHMSTSYIAAAKILNPSHVIPVVFNSFYLGPIEAGHVHEECFEE